MAQNFGVVPKCCHNLLRGKPELAAQVAGNTPLRCGAVTPMGWRQADIHWVSKEPTEEDIGSLHGRTP